MPDKPKTGNPNYAASSFSLSKTPWKDTPYTRDTFMRDLGKASRKLEPEERSAKKKPSGRSGGTT